MPSSALRHRASRAPSCRQPEAGSSPSRDVDRGTRDRNPVARTDGVVVPRRAFVEIAPCRLKKLRPANRRNDARASEITSRQRPTLPPTYAGSTIGAEGLNCRVRNGNGCFPLARVTGKVDRMKSTSPNRIRSLQRPDSPASKTINGQAERPISTGQLKASQPLHLPPINLVVYEGSSGRPHLQGGFPLRCFQRLSFPNIATQPCHWRDNWCTRGSSVPVLSY